MTLLMISAKNGHLKVAQALIKNKANVNELDK